MNRFVLKHSSFLLGLVEQNCYYEDRISKYMISSGTTTIMSLLCFTLGIYLKSETDLNFTGNVFLVVFIVVLVCLFGLQIWGGIIFFPHWVKWKDKLDQFPCNKYVFEFGSCLLNLFWFFSLAIFLNICLMCKNGRS